MATSIALNKNHYMLRRLDYSDAYMTNDGRWAKSSFGSYGWCYKIYKNAGSAKRRAARYAPGTVEVITWNKEDLEFYDSNGNRIPDSELP